MFFCHSNSIFKGALKLNFMHLSCVAIILSSLGLFMSEFSTHPHTKVVFGLAVLPVFSL